jgi:uncharacterized protein YcbX
VPHVAWISIAPVKGLGLVHPEEVMLERYGVRDNRRFYLIDARGRMTNGKRLGPLVRVRPQLDDGRLTLNLPDAEPVSAPIEHGEPITTSFFGRDVAGHLVEGPFSAALSKLSGMELRLAEVDEPGAGSDRGTMGGASLLSEAALSTLGDRTLDSRRFRMLFGIGDVEANAEDGWIDREVTIGDAVVVPRGNVGRCLITSQNPDTGRPDFDTLGALRERRSSVPTTEPLPFGVYAAVLRPGRVRLGDKVIAAPA